MSAGLLSLVKQLCHVAGAVHMRHFRRLPSIERKSAIDLVTVADRESEEAVASLVRAAHPDHALLLEESGAQGAAAAEWTWVVDPLDGTTNFAHGLRLFAVSIGVLHRGVPVVGGIFAPALDEMYLAVRGKGAFRNGERLRVSPAATLEESLLVTGFPYDRRKHLDGLLAMARETLARTQGMLRLGAASLDLAAVAAGNLDGFYEYNLKPWDVAAGYLLVEEAGGRVTQFRGEPASILEPWTTVATNGLIHDAVLEHITSLFPPITAAP